LIFQDSIGIDIKHDEVVLAYLKQSFKGVRLAAHSVYTMETDKSGQEGLETLKSIISDFKTENQIHKSNLVIGLSNETIILREIEYPIAVKENLRSTLDYDIDKYIPLSADEVYFDYQVIEEDRVNNRLKILLALMKKSDLEPYLSFCRKWPGGVYGLCLSSVAAANCHAFLSGNKKRLLNGHIREILMQEGDVLSDKDVFHPSALAHVGIPVSGLIPAFGLGMEILWEVPIRINLLPMEIRKKPSRVGHYTLIGLVALLILCGVAWGGGTLLRQKMRLRAVEEEIGRLSSEVITVSKTQERINEIEDNLQILKAIKDGDPLILDILRELTRTIPETAWLTDFRLTEKGIQLSGYAQSASELIPLLEASPLFEDVVQLSAWTRDPRQGKERFHIGLSPVSSKESE
jgi:Tfp pilus assembly protein PilN